MFIKMQMTVYAEVDNDTYEMYKDHEGETIEALINCNNSKIIVEEIKESDIPKDIKPENWVNPVDNSEDDED